MVPPCVRVPPPRLRAAAPMYAQLPQIQVTQEMQHLKEQVGQIDQLLRTQHPQPTLNQLNANGYSSWLNFRAWRGSSRAPK